MKVTYKLDKIWNVLGYYLDMYITDSLTDEDKLIAFGADFTEFTMFKLEELKSAEDLCELMSIRLKSLKRFVKIIAPPNNPLSVWKQPYFYTKSTDFYNLFDFFEYIAEMEGRSATKEFSSLENELDFYKIYRQIIIDAYTSAHYDKTILDNMLEKVNLLVNELRNNNARARIYRKERAN